MKILKPIYLVVILLGFTLNSCKNSVEGGQFKSGSYSLNFIDNSTVEWNMSSHTETCSYEIHESQIKVFRSILGTKQVFNFSLLDDNQIERVDDGRLFIRE